MKNNEQQRTNEIVERFANEMVSFGEWHKTASEEELHEYRQWCKEEDEKWNGHRWDNGWSQM